MLDIGGGSGSKGGTVCDEMNEQEEKTIIPCEKKLKDQMRKRAKQGSASAVPEPVAVFDKVGLNPTRIDIHQCFVDEQPSTDN